MISLGRVVQLECALNMMRGAGISPAVLLNRHARGDRGEIPIPQEHLADAGGSEVMSFYRLPTGDAIWVWTGVYRSELITSMVGIRPEEI